MSEPNGRTDPPPTYLSQAILMTIFCCGLFGIISIVYAAQVAGRLEVGNIEGAWVASKKARYWAWVAFWVGLVEKFILFLILAGVLVAAYLATRSTTAPMLQPGP
jgi:hypothetical protein